MRSRSKREVTASVWPIPDAASHPRISLISLTAFIAQINHGREQSPGRAAGPVSDSPSRSGLLSCTQVLSDSNTDPHGSVFCVELPFDNRRQPETEPQQDASVPAL